MKVTAKVTVPFDIDVTHVFSRDAGLIQSHVCGVPDDGTQEMPVYSEQCMHVNMQANMLA